MKNKKGLFLLFGVVMLLSLTGFRHNHPNDILSTVRNGDYQKAYAEALVEGLKVPSQEADNLMKQYEKTFQKNETRYAPRLVRDENEELHIIWTNDEMFLVIDGEETDLEVADCIDTNSLPKLPETLGELEKYHPSYDIEGFSIAENAFLENLSQKLKKKNLYKNGLIWCRFYEYGGNPVAVYTLIEDEEVYMNWITEKDSDPYKLSQLGKLYINDSLADTILQ